MSYEISWVHEPSKITVINEIVGDKLFTEIDDGELDKIFVYALEYYKYEEYAQIIPRIMKKLKIGKEAIFCLNNLGQLCKSIVMRGVEPEQYNSMLFQGKVSAITVDRFLDLARNFGALTKTKMDGLQYYVTVTRTS